MGGPSGLMGAVLVVYQRSAGYGSRGRTLREKRLTGIFGGRPMMAVCGMSVGEGGRLCPQEACGNSKSNRYNLKLAKLYCCVLLTHWMYVVHVSDCNHTTCPDRPALVAEVGIRSQTALIDRCMTAMLRLREMTRPPRVTCFTSEQAIPSAITHQSSVYRTRHETIQRLLHAAWPDGGGLLQTDDRWFQVVDPQQH